MNSTQTGQDLSARRWRPSAAWIAIAIYFVLVAFGSNLLEIRYSYFDPGLAGSWGFNFTWKGPDAIVQSVDPGSKAAALGIRAGDRLRSDAPFVFRTIPLAGETLRFTRVSPRPATAMQFIAPRADPAPMAVPNLVDRVFDDSVRVLLVLTGMFILWRGSRRRSGFLLGLALLAMFPFPAEWMPFGPYPFYGWALAVDSLMDLAFALFLPLFAMAFLTEWGVRVPTWAKLIFWIGLAETLFGFVFGVVLPPLFLPGAAYDIANRLALPSTMMDFALAISLLVIGWRRAAAEARHRFALLLLAVGLIFLSNMLFELYYLFNTAWHSDPRLLTNTSTLSRVLGTSLFAYAVLRHRVIDVGFTLNRTLVYGGVSAILLATFGLAEWGAHEALALEGWQGSALLSAGLAVAIVLTFHPVRRFVEHYVSTFLFRPWRNKEQVLRKFVHQAGFFTDSRRLAAAFAGALGQFSGGTCFVYQRSEDRSFACAMGDMPTVHADDPTAVALKAQADVCEIDRANSIVDGALAFPMIHCHDLEGFAVLGTKSDGERYRPDEIELVEWATRQVGQDLYALTVDQLRAEREERDREIAVLAGRNADLQLALANRSAAKLRRVPKAAAAQ